MEPMTMALVALNVVGAAAATHVLDDAIAPLWKDAKAAIRKSWQRDPRPSDFDPELKGIMDADLLAEAERLFGASPVLRRVKLVSSVFRGARILWVDDQPKWNTYEAGFLRSLKVQVDQVLTSEEARARFRGGNYDLVISDMARGDNSQAGLDLLLSTSERPPVIFYVLQLDERPTPVGAVGITNRADELFHLIMDGLERRRA